MGTRWRHSGYILHVEAAGFLDIVNVSNEREKSRMTPMCFPLKAWRCVCDLEYDDECFNVTESILAKCTEI